MAIEAEKIATTGRMAAAIAHEINNPLGSVLNLIYLARQDGLSVRDIQNYLATAESELERVSHIARQTLGYYRDTGSPSEVYLHDLIENVLSVYRNKLLAHNIGVQARFNDLWKIRVHSGEIVQVFSNVISNAIDAMPKGGRLSIAINQVGRSEQEGLQVVVKASATMFSDPRTPLLWFAAPLSIIAASSVPATLLSISSALLIQ
jgi:signal transduction histidine kinase